MSSLSAVSCRGRDFAPTDAEVKGARDPDDGTDDGADGAGKDHMGGTEPPVAPEDTLEEDGGAPMVAGIEPD